MYKTDKLEQRLKEKRQEWTKFPERRARIEEEVKVLKIGLRFLQAKNDNDPNAKPELVEEDYKEALL